MPKIARLNVSTNGKVSSNGQSNGNGIVNGNAPKSRMTDASSNGVSTYTSVNGIASEATEQFTGSVNGSAGSQRNEVPDTLRPFIFHGIHLNWRKGATKGEALAECPFCGKEGKFSVNIEDGQYKCWSCGEGSEKGGGNARIFIRKLMDLSFDATKYEDYEALAAERNYLNADGLITWKAAWSVTQQEWIASGYGIDGSLNQLYRYVPIKQSNGSYKNRLLPTPSLSGGHQLHGPDGFNSNKPIIDICEGFWDGIILWETLRIAKFQENSSLGVTTENDEESLLSERNVIAIPGANIFFERWLPLFAGKIVNIWYHNDHPIINEKTGKEQEPAGLRGLKRVTEMLASYKEPPAEINYLCWGEEGYTKEYKSGYDLRDYIPQPYDIDDADPDDEDTKKTWRVSRLHELLSRIKPCPKEWFTSDASQSFYNNGAPAEEQAKKDAMTSVYCDNYAELLAKWKRGMRWRQEMDDVLSIMLAVALSTEQIGDQLFLMVIAGAGCIDGETVIHDPIANTNLTVKERYDIGEKFNVWTRKNDGSVGVAQALPPTKFTIEPLYRVTFKSGRSILVTRGHQFWDGASYLSVLQVQDVLLSYSSLPVPTISEFDLSVRERDVLNSTRIAQGYQCDCYACSCPCDEQPRSEVDTCRYVVPSQVYVQEHDYDLSKDDLACRRKRNDQAGLYDPLSKRDYQNPASTLDVYEPCVQPRQHTSLQSQHHIETELHIQRRKLQKDIDQQLSYVSPYSIYVDVSQQDHNQLNNETPQSEKLQQSSQLHGLSDLLDTCQESTESSHQKDDAAFLTSIRVNSINLTASTVLEYDEIVKVEYEKDDYYYDFSVPETKNYLAAGVFNHNSGKTRFCDAMLVSSTTHALEHITGFHSGWKNEKGEDCSLIARINRKTLITPEGDVLMSSPKFSEIMSQQRRIFDGTSGATFKNQKEDMRYTGLRTPWIIAGTHSLMDSDQSRLGDRFLRVIIDPPDNDERRQILRRVGFTAIRCVKQTSDGSETQVDEKMAEAYKVTGGYIDWLRSNASELLQNLTIDEEYVVDVCTVLAEFTAYLRARPDPDHKKDTKASKEEATRLTHQYVRLACCLAVVLNKKAVDVEVMRRVAKVALDTSRGHTLDALKEIYVKQSDPDKEKSMYDKCVTVEGLTHATHRTDNARVHNMLKFMRGIGITETYKTKIKGVSMKPRWRLTQVLFDLYTEVLKYQ